MEPSADIAAFQHGRVPRSVRGRQLVELAEELFAERGYAGASMDELARRAGVTKPVIYEHFENKDGLFAACIDRAVARMAQSVADAVRAETDPERRLRAGGLAFLRFAAEHSGPAFLEQALRVRRSQADLISELLGEVAAAGVDPRELEAMAWAVNAAYEGVAHWMSEHPDVPVEEVAEWTVELLLPGLRRLT